MPETEYRVVLRKFRGDRWIETSEVVDVSGWRNARLLQNQRYLRPLYYGEEPFDSGDGRLWLSEDAMRLSQGAPVASSAASPDLGPQADESSDGPQESTASEEDADADDSESSDDGEGEETESETGEAEEGGEEEVTGEEEVSGGDDAGTRDTRTHQYHVEEVGGGWYNVLDEHGATMNPRTLHGKARAQTFMDGLE